MALDLEAVFDLPARPEPWTSGTHSVWTDARLRMLDAHLDEGTDAASRRPETIDATVAWIDGLLAGSGRVLDLGCGPGLYAQRLARLGHEVTGVDLSDRSLEHARRESRREGLDVRYVHGDYTEIELDGSFDLIILIYFDLGVLDPIATEKLLERVHRWLAEDGVFVFDVLTPASLPDEESQRWGGERSGFWAPTPHLWLERTQLHGPGDVLLDETVVVSEDEPPRVYRVWERRYSPEGIQALLGAADLRVERLVGDLTGTAPEPGGQTLGVVATRRG